MREMSEYLKRIKYQRHILSNNGWQKKMEKYLNSAKKKHFFEHMKPIYKDEIKIIFGIATAY